MTASDYGHGGGVFAAAKLLNRPWTEIIDFSASINPFGQCKGLKKYIFDNFAATLHYPEVDAQSLLEVVAKRHNLTPDHFLPGAGSTVLIYAVARLLGGKRNVILGPAFSEYENALKVAEKSFVYFNLQEDDQFLLTENQLDRLLDLSPNLIFLANPANPTGRLTPAPVYKKLLDECETRKIQLIVDEAFLDFTFGATIARKTSRNDRLIILRSLTKIMAIPGLRLAYLIAGPEVINRLKPLIGPWPLSYPALAAGVYYLTTQFVKPTLSIDKLRSALTKVLQPYGEVCPSEANYLLFKYNPEKVLDLLAFLFKKGILVRDAQNFNGLTLGYLRFATRPLGEIKVLAQSLAEFHA
ncbi:MAG: aminotransferase class I/II-fold pyridoxal phosphate-dependent enzyme [Deltaproteobacteria bacterium]|jgi:threonine-phosphate decarboxylase|nr:aminotransferase class I/II-fold pyridoxal phosphate-dependent enzyme [Deltaproteobacteria bacterium]